MKTNLANYEFDDNVIINFNKMKKAYKEKKVSQNFRIAKEIWFNDMEWDFNFRNTNNRAEYNYRFNYDSIPDPYVFHVKVTVLNEVLTRKNKIGTAKRMYRSLRTITKDLYKDEISDVRLIDEKIVQELIEVTHEKNQSSYIANLSGAFKRFLDVIKDIDGYKFERCIKYLEKTQCWCNKKRPIKAVNDYIPGKFLNQIVSLAMKDIDDTSLEIKNRIMACLIVIMAETGMRAEEVTLLETNKLDVTRNKKMPYLKFLTFKTIKRETYTWLSDKALKAYQMCESFINKVIDNLSEQSKLKLLIFLHNNERILGRKKITELRSMISKIDKDTLERLELEARRYLFIDTKTGFQKKGTALFRENLEKFFVRHFNDFDLEIVPAHERDNIKVFQIKSKSKYEKFFTAAQRRSLSFEEIKNCKYPYVNPHMFRVTVCTKLFMQDTPLDFIIRHLNHVSGDMTNYYNKEQEYKDKLAEGMKIFSLISNSEGLIQTDTALIQDEFLKKEFNNEEVKENIEKINNFLKKHKLNIKKDLNEIIKILQKTNSPIIENDFGVCMRSMIFGICEKRKYFSSLSDNYFIGIQLSTYRYMHFSYERFKQKVQVVEHNKKIAENDERYLSEYEREVKALKMFVNKTIKSEIELLEKDIDKHGIESIVQKHPQLESIISEIDEVRKEIKEWII